MNDVIEWPCNHRSQSYFIYQQSTEHIWGRVFNYSRASVVLAWIRPYATVMWNFYSNIRLQAETVYKIYGPKGMTSVEDKDTWLGSEANFHKHLSSQMEIIAWYSFLNTLLFITGELLFFTTLLTLAVHLSLLSTLPAAHVCNNCSYDNLLPPSFRVKLLQVWFKTFCLSVLYRYDCIGFLFAMFSKFISKVTLSSTAARKSEIRCQLPAG